MWEWLDADNTYARRDNGDGTYCICGINCDPLASWLAAGNTPEPWEAPVAD